MRSTVVVLALGLMLPNSTLAEPTKLSIGQLDLITAGISATVDANALGLGSRSAAKTNTNTATIEGRFVSIALGRGSAFAMGTDSAETSVNATAEGGRVKTFSRTLTKETPRGVISRSHGFVVAIDVHHDVVRAAGPAR